MPYSNNNGVRIAYTETGDKGHNPVLLLHGCGLDRTSLAAQASYLSSDHHVISPDLRGHGESDKPRLPYELAAFAEDLYSLCKQSNVEKLIVIGHSMGGNIALSFAHLYPEMVSALCLIDSALFIPEKQKHTLAAQCAAAAQAGETSELLKGALRSMCLPGEHRSIDRIDGLITPEYVLASALPAHTVDFDAHTLTQEFTVPLAYIHSNMPFVNLDALRLACPQVITAATLGSGHLSPLEVPDQINAMLSHFLYLNSDLEYS